MLPLVDEPLLERRLCELELAATVGCEFGMLIGDDFSARRAVGVSGRGALLLGSGEARGDASVMLSLGIAVAGESVSASAFCDGGAGDPAHSAVGVVPSAACMAALIATAAALRAFLSLFSRRVISLRVHPSSAAALEVYLFSTLGGYHAGCWPASFPSPLL